MCYFCGTKLPLREKIGFREACPDCGRPLHVCLNCTFYKPGAHWDCAETVEEQVPDKEKGNFCEWFVPVPEARDSYGRGTRRDGDVRTRFDDLFKK